MSMRQGQQHKRMRGRGRKGPNPLSRAYESNGPDVKIRGTALQVAEKYLQMSRDAQAAGDRVHSENLLQHAEHYFRIVAAAQAQSQAAQAQQPRAEEGGERQQQPVPNEQPSVGPSDPQPYVNGNGADPEAKPEVKSEAATAEAKQPEPDGEKPEAKAEEAEPRPRPRRRRTYRERTDDKSQSAPAEPGAGCRQRGLSRRPAQTGSKRQTASFNVTL